MEFSWILHWTASLSKIFQDCSILVFIACFFLFLGCSKWSLKTARLFSDRRPPRMVAPQYRAAEICQKNNLLISCCPLQASAVVPSLQLLPASQRHSASHTSLHCTVYAVCTQHGSAKSALSRDFPPIVWQPIHNFNATSLVVQLHLKPLINNNRGGNSSNAHYCLFANPTAQRRNRTWTAGTPAMMRSMLWWATSLAIFLAANKSCDGLVDNHSSQNAKYLQFKTQSNFYNLLKKGDFICSGRRDGFRKGNDFFQALPELPPSTPPFPTI